MARSFASGCCGLALLGLAALAGAAEPAPQLQNFSAPPLVDLARQGYAFESPRILARQRLFGLHHGVTLLAHACRQHQQQVAEVDDAVTAWEAGLSGFMQDTLAELKSYYYGARAAEADAVHLVRALNLREQLDIAPEALAPACQSLPTALREPRYALADRFALEGALAQHAVVVRAEAAKFFCQNGNEHVQAIESAFASWQRNNEDAAKMVLTTLEALWEAQRLEGSVAEWQKAQQTRLQKQGKAQCEGLPAWLNSPAAQLVNVFALPQAPVIVLQDEASPTAPVAVTLPVPSAAPEVSTEIEVQQMPSPVEESAPRRLSEEEVRPPGLPELIDWITNVFNGPKQTDAAADSSVRRLPSSPRAHP